MKMKYCFGIGGKIVSQKCVVMEEWTHTRDLYSFPRQMVVELSKTLEYTVELEGPMFLDVVARPSGNWLLNSLVTQIFLQLVIQKKEYMKRNLEMNIVDKVNMVDKEVDN